MIGRPAPLCPSVYPGGDASTQAVLVGGATKPAGKGADAAPAPAAPVMTLELGDAVLSALDLPALQDRLMHVLWLAAQSATKEDGAYGAGTAGIVCATTWCFCC